MSDAGAPTASSRRVARRLFTLPNAIALALAIVLVVAWEIAVDAFRVPGYIVPAPSRILEAFQRGFARRIYPPHLWATLEAMVAGYAIGTTLGILLGALIAEFKLVERVVYPYVVSLQSLPKIALAPLFVMWFGYGLTSKVVTVALICFFPLMVNTMTGLLSTQRDRLDMVRTMTATRWQLFRHVKLPSAAGHVFAGLQVAVVLSLIGALVAEFVGADRGLGNLIQISQSNMDTAGVFTVLVILAVIGMVATALVRWIHRRVVFWEAHGAEPGASDAS